MSNIEGMAVDRTTSLLVPIRERKIRELAPRNTEAEGFAKPGKEIPPEHVIHLADLDSHLPVLRI
jgi:hypothetical protein